MRARLRRYSFEAVRQVHRWPWRWGLPPLAVVLVNAALALPGWRIPLLTPVAWTFFVLVNAWWLWDRVLMPLPTDEWLRRRDEWAARHQGTAAWVDILEVAGRGAMRLKARVIRPSLDSLSRWSLFRLPATAYAVTLARSGWFRVWTPGEMWTLRLGGPRMGKTGSLAAHAVDAPGALVVTSTRADLLDLTGPVRAGKGRIHVFNPAGYGGLRSTVRWSLLVGCADYATAQRRAADLIPDSIGDGARWDDQARRLLALLLHAAALSGRSVGDIVRWVSLAGDAVGVEVAGCLRESGSAVALMSQARETFGANDRTLTSITTTLMGSLSWVADARAAEIGDAPVDHPDLLDVAAFVRSGTDSLYLVTPAESGLLAALVGALTAEIAFQARVAAGDMPGGRLDPPLTLCLDEAPLTCGRVPLDRWSADFGGRGITGHVTAQSLAQLRELYGEAGSETILTNCGALMVFGGIKGAVDLERLSTLTGRRMMQVDEDDRRYVEVMAPAEIASLPEGRALLIRALMPPVVGEVPFRVWERKDVKRAAGTWQPELSEPFTPTDDNVVAFPAVNA